MAIHDLSKAKLDPSGRPVDLIAADCVDYRGDRPCKRNRLCRGCNHYTPTGTRLCVIKLGALGDVIRTLCILPGLKEKYPHSQITWVTKDNAARMLQGHPQIDRLLRFDAITSMTLAAEAFDTVICLDKEPEPCALAMALRADEKLGVGLNAWGKPVPLNAEAHAYFHLGLSDELKFHRNEKSYPRLVYEALGLAYHGQRYLLPHQAASDEQAHVHLHRAGFDFKAPTVGINVGAGNVFANKMWPADRIVDVIGQLKAESPKVQVLLLGGPGEQPIVERIVRMLRTRGQTHLVINPGTDHDEQTFVSIVDHCDVLFSGDTMAMHVAIALGIPAVVVFGPTCHQEIDLFGRGEKIIADVACGPCYKRECDQSDRCTQMRDTSEVVKALLRQMGHAREGHFTLPVLPWRKAG